MTDFAVMLAALVAWRNRWATGLRLLAPLVFLAMALMVQEVMNMNAEMTGRIRDMPATYPEQITSIPACSTELFIHTKPCLDFIFTPKDDARVQVSSCAGASGAAMDQNQHCRGAGMESSMSTTTVPKGPCVHVRCAPAQHA